MHRHANLLKRTRYATNRCRESNGTIARYFTHPDRESTVMQEQKARQILQALIQGVDPFNGEELATGSVLQQPDVLRAMLVGVAALEAGAARAARRAQMPENVGRPW